MGNQKKRKKLSITLEGDILSAVIGNAGFFVECGGFGDEVLRQTHSRLARRISLTENQVESILNIIDTISDGVKYPSKSGREYNGLMAFRELLINERLRQWNQLAKGSDSANLTP